MPDKDMEIHFARELLRVGAVQLALEEPFTWASGLRAPIYCDNRLILSEPGLRQSLIEAFGQICHRHYPGVQLIAGVATGGIPYGAMLAEKLGLPFVYVRSQSKGHGLGKMIEGRVQAGQQTLVLEDLVSTGQSSLAAVRSLKEAHCQILGMLAIFTYELPATRQAFLKAACPLHVISRFPVLVRVAVSSGLISEEACQRLLAWRDDPVGWSGKHPT